MARLHVRVRPGARRAGFDGWFGDMPRLSVRARPVDGAANEEVIALVAAELGLPRRAVTIVGGSRSRTKRLEIAGLTDNDLADALSGRNPGAGSR